MLSKRRMYNYIKKIMDSQNLFVKLRGFLINDEWTQIIT